MVGNLLQQNVEPPTANHCRAEDTTFISTSAGWCNVDSWTDLSMRRVSGWKLDRQTGAVLTTKVLNPALTAAMPSG